MGMFVRAMQETYQEFNWKTFVQLVTIMLNCPHLEVKGMQYIQEKLSDTLWQNKMMLPQLKV